MWEKGGGGGEKHRPFLNVHRSNFATHSKLSHTGLSSHIIPSLGIFDLTHRVTKDENLNGEISMSKKRWTKIYERTHSPSFVGYCELDLSSNPVILKPGQVKGMYIHSTLRGDAAIVYDNKEKPKTHDDSFITILPGRAHVSQRIFGSIPVWGW